MTENEAKQVLEKAIEQSAIAIEKLKAIESDVERTDRVREYYSILENCVKEQESCVVAIQSLEEIQQYRAIGTVEEFKALKEKAEPRKDDNDCGRCTACGTYNNFILSKLAHPEKHPVIHCWNCGQAIKWE